MFGLCWNWCKASRMIVILPFLCSPAAAAGSSGHGSIQSFNIADSAPDLCSSS